MRARARAGRAGLLARRVLLQSHGSRDGLQYLGSGIPLVDVAQPAVGLLQITTVLLMVVFPVFFFPYSKTLFLAFDLLVRPPTEEDFAVPHEEARRHKHSH